MTNFRVLYAVWCMSFRSVVRSYAIVLNICIFPPTDTDVYLDSGDDPTSGGSGRVESLALSVRQIKDSVCSPRNFEGTVKGVENFWTAWGSAVGSIWRMLMRLWRGILHRAADTGGVTARRVNSHGRKTASQTHGEKRML
jgi:hypothetical protein